MAGDWVMSSRRVVVVLLSAALLGSVRARVASNGGRHLAQLDVPGVPPLPSAPPFDDTFGSEPDEAPIAADSVAPDAADPLGAPPVATEPEAEEPSPDFDVAQPPGGIDLPAPPLPTAPSLPGLPPTPAPPPTQEAGSAPGSGSGTPEDAAAGLSAMMGIAVGIASMMLVLV